jgi:hypothetical protein
MTRAEDELATLATAALDGLLLDLDQQIARVEVPSIPKPSGVPGPADDAGAGALQDLADRLLTARARLSHHRSEQMKWMAEAERAVRDFDSARAKTALEEYGVHARAVSEVESEMDDLVAIIEELRQMLFSRHPIDSHRPPDDDTRQSGLHEPGE